jgi:hypothetical protein
MYGSCVQIVRARASSSRAFKACGDLMGQETGQRYELRIPDGIYREPAAVATVRKARILGESHE